VANVTRSGPNRRPGYGDGSVQGERRRRGQHLAARPESPVMYRSSSSGAARCPPAGRQPTASTTIVVRERRRAVAYRQIQVRRPGRSAPGARWSARSRRSGRPRAGASRPRNWSSGSGRTRRVPRAAADGPADVAVVDHSSNARATSSNSSGIRMPCTAISALGSPETRTSRWCGRRAPPFGAGLGRGAPGLAVGRGLRRFNVADGGHPNTPARARCMSSSTPVRCPTRPWTSRSAAPACPVRRGQREQHPVERVSRAAECLGARDLGGRREGPSGARDRREAARTRSRRPAGAPGRARWRPS